MFLQNVLGNNIHRHGCVIQRKGTKFFPLTSGLKWKEGCQELRDETSDILYDAHTFHSIVILLKTVKMSIIKRMICSYSSSSQFKSRRHTIASGCRSVPCFGKCYKFGTLIFINVESCCIKWALGILGGDLFQEPHDYRIPWKSTRGGGCSIAIIVFGPLKGTHGLLRNLLDSNRRYFLFARESGNAFLSRLGGLLRYPFPLLRKPPRSNQKPVVSGRSSEALQLQVQHPPIWRAHYTNIGPIACPTFQSHLQYLSLVVIMGLC